jgi:hypothetical protein
MKVRHAARYHRSSPSGREYSHDEHEGQVRVGVHISLVVGFGGEAGEVADQVRAAHASLLAARELPAPASVSGRPLAGALVEVGLPTAEAVPARGAGVLRGSANPPLRRTPRVLARCA